MKKKLIALTVATVMMTSSMTALAAKSPTTSNIVVPPAHVPQSTTALQATTAPQATTAASDSSAPAAITPVTSTATGTGALSAAEVAAMTFRSPAAIQAVADAYGMSYAEVANNSISSAEGVAKDDFYAFSQGDKILINGEPSNQKVILRKVTDKNPAKKAIKDDLNGKLVNYFSAILPVADGNTVSVNFYVPKIKGTETNLIAQQYVDGKWVDVKITEVRKNHVILDLDKSGVVRFVLS